MACAVGGRAWGAGARLALWAWKAGWPGVCPCGHFSARAGAAPRPSPYFPHLDGRVLLLRPLAPLEHVVQVGQEHADEEHGLLPFFVEQFRNERNRA